MKFTKSLCTWIIAAAVVFAGLFTLTTEAKAADVGDLIFSLNSDGESYCVSDCYQFASGALEIPSTYNGKPVTSIDWYAFSDCSSLTSITIPDSVTSIGDYAFYGCSSLTSVTIPNSVTSIGDWAFSDCSSLTSITIPDSVTSIGDYVFKNCSSLTSITIPDSVTSIGDYAFSGCSNLEYNIYDNAKYLGNSANPYFALIEAKDTSITKCEIHNTTKVISDGAFRYCSSLTSITIPDSVTSIGEEAFYNCNIKKLIIADGSKEVNSTIVICEDFLQEVIIPDSVTSIGSYAFYNCSSLAGVTIGNDVTSIGGNAFRGCGSLKSITIPDSVTSIGNNAFFDCSSLMSITIPDCVASIGDYAFNDCSNLTSVTIGNGVTSIGGSAFYNCSSLTSITIPDSVTSIGSSAFSGCSSLTSITIPDRVASIGDYAFNDCSSLTSVTIGDGVTSIGIDVFSGCNKLEFNIHDNARYLGNSVNPCLVLVDVENTSITTYEIQDATKVICGGAFENCSSLTSITISDSVTSIGKRTFYNCSSLTSITIPDCVTRIGESAFYNCISLTSIIIPDGVTSIDYCAFSGSALTSITIPGSVTSIGEHAFSNCYNLEYSIYENAKYLGNSVNPYVALVKAVNTSITTCTVHNETKIISDCAFADCSNLTNITIPASVTDIGNSAFEYCSSLTGVAIPDNVTSIGFETFQYCSELTSITIPDGVTSIDGFAFYNCRKLTSVIIPDSVTSIGYAAFSDCYSLADVYYTGSEADWKAISNSFLFDADIHYNHVPANAKVTRVFGATRYDTAFDAANMLKERLGVAKFDTIVVACGTDFADALSGSYLANQKNAPILLVRNRNQEINQVKDYIKANLKTGGTVYLLGGTNAIPKSMETGLDGYTVKRLAGATRYETSLAIIQEAGVGDKDILVCTGKNFADGLSASAVNMPIMLVKDSLSASQKTFLSGLKGNKIVIIGGTAAVNTRIENALKAYGTTERIEGATRYYTSVNIAKKYFPNATGMVVAYADNFPDGLSGGPLAYSADAPLILVMNGKQAAAVSYAREMNIKSGMVLGGTTLVSDSVVKQLFSMGSNDTIQIK